MDDDVTVLGLSIRGGKDWLTFWRILVRARDDESVDVVELEKWDATRGKDEASQLLDAFDSITNALDSVELGAPVAVGVKRAEMPRGRPPTAYDRKVHFEGAAMVAAARTGRRFFAYRNNQLARGRGFREACANARASLSSDEAAEALDAACAALGDLSQLPD